MKRNLITSALLLALPLSAFVQAQTVEFFTPKTVRVLRDNGKAADKSLVVISTPENVKVTKTTANGATIYKSSALTVTVKDGKVTFADAKGNVLMTEGESKFTPISSGPDADKFRVKQAFSLDKDEEIYGVGLLQNGKMSQRDENRRMEQSNLEDFAHFYQSIKGYGIYWDNYSPTRLATPKQGEAGEVVLESEVGKKSDYYFMYGKDADGVIREMRHLTGKAPMLPLWTYGFHQSRERYKTQDETIEVVRKYRDLKIPFDGIIQDWQYWGSNYTWNAMEFLNEDFGRAQDLINEVHQKNAHMSISIWSSFGPETKAFKELKSKGLLFDFQTWPQSGLSFWPPRKDYPSGVRVYDCYSSEARDIYWKYLSNLHNMGIDAWWMDSTDPDQMDFQDSQLDQKSTMGTYRSVRNLFPFMCVTGVYDHQREAEKTMDPSKKKRPFILTRSYFAGQQRTGANTWSGDINSSWDSFRKQIPICLNYTLTANPQVNTDIGGFFAGSYNTQGKNSGTRNPQYQELYVRWMQFGAFCPMMRSHGTDVYRELYYFGKQGEPVYDALVDAVKLRYKFLPYIYSQSWQVSKNDDSFMRALFMDFKADKNTWNNNREYMFGRNILVCPVVDPLYTPEKKVQTDAMTGWDNNAKLENKNGYMVPDWTVDRQFEVYLPAGTKWYDYWTNNVLEGGQSIKASAPLAHSPLYIKAGTILPQGPEVQYTSEKKWDNLELLIYPGANGEFTLYEDEGDNLNYENGAYSTIKMTWNDKAKTLTIGQRQGSFDGMLTSRTFIVKTPNGQKSVSYNGKKVSVKL